MKKKFLSMLKKVPNVLLIMFMILMITENVVYATQPEFVTKTVNLIDTAINWLILLAGGTTVFFVAKGYIESQASDDQAKRASAMGKVKWSFISFIGILIAKGVVSFLEGIYA